MATQGRASVAGRYPIYKAAFAAYTHMTFLSLLPTHMLEGSIKTSNNKGKGIHVFRYTLAKRLLETQIPHQIITDTLGHASNDSDKYYYSMEEEKLKMCCLDARWIGVKTWK